jgi:hypothetical protein
MVANGSARTAADRAGNAVQSGETARSRHQDAMACPRLRTACVRSLGAALEGVGAGSVMAQPYQVRMTGSAHAALIMPPRFATGVRAMVRGGGGRAMHGKKQASGPGRRRTGEGLGTTRWILKPESLFGPATRLEVVKHP